jgi:hypothetical protein
MCVTRFGVERGAWPASKAAHTCPLCIFPGLYAHGSVPQVVASQLVHRAHAERLAANQASPTVRCAPYCKVLAHACSTARNRFCRDISNNRLTGSIPSIVSSLRALTRVYAPSPKLAVTHLPRPCRLEEDRRRVGRAAPRSRLHLVGMESCDGIPRHGISQHRTRDGLLHKGNGAAGTCQETDSRGKYRFSESQRRTEPGTTCAVLHHHFWKALRKASSSGVARVPVHTRNCEACMRCRLRFSTPASLRASCQCACAFAVVVSSPS